MAVQDVVEVDLGGHLVTVPKGGLYDGFGCGPTSMRSS